MNLKEAENLVLAVGGKDAATGIIFNSLEPKDNRFKWWDVQSQDYALISISESSVYIPELKKALQKLKYI